MPLSDGVRPGPGNGPTQMAIPAAPWPDRMARPRQRGLWNAAPDRRSGQPDMARRDLTSLRVVPKDDLRAIPPRPGRVPAASAKAAAA